MSGRALSRTLDLNRPGDELAPEVREVISIAAEVMLAHLRKQVGARADGPTKTSLPELPGILPQPTRRSERRRRRIVRRAASNLLVVSRPPA